MTDAIQIDNHAQLFLDDRLIDRADNLSRTVHQPEPFAKNPIVRCDKPWEFDCITLWGTVLWDEQDQLFKMWYQTWGNVQPPRVSTFVCYATSKDGIEWEKPELGVVGFDGDAKTNIVLAPKRAWLDSPTVVKDLADPDPSKRYKLAWCESGPNDPPAIFHATSSDGIHWDRFSDAVLQAGDRNSLFHDAQRKKWVVITRMAGIADRTIAFAEGDEFGKYGPQRLIFRHDEKDPPESDLYSMPTFAYAGMRIGCIEVYDHRSRREITQLAWSYDGVNWQRDPERKPFMLWSNEPSFDWARRTPQNGAPIERDGKLWFYFGGRSTLKQSQDPRRIVGALGLAFLRIDGFCSRDAGEKEGVLTTKPLRFSGNSLHVNAHVKGTLLVEALDASGQPIQGFVSEPVQGDNVDHAIHWKDGKKLAELSQPIALRFKMSKAELYSFRFTA
jgi:hypothetical protein